MNNKFDLKKFLAEGKLVKDNEVIAEGYNKEEIKEEEVNEGRGAMSFVKQAIDELMFDDPEIETEKDAAEELIIAIADEYGFDFAGHENDVFGRGMDEDVNESAADVQELIIGLLGTGGMAAATIGISKLMDALESGQHGEHGKKVAQALKKLGNAAAKSRNVSEEEVEESAPGYAHDCAAHVVHEVYGYGLCLEGQHTLVETTEGRAKVTHYDVLFKNGSRIVENIPVEELQIESIEEHTHSKKK